MTKKTEQHFKVKSVSKISDFVENPDKILDTSNLTLQNGDHIVQFEFVDEEDAVREKYKIKPGFSNLEQTNAGMKLAPFEVKQKKLLTGINNTVTIEKEISIFFEDLDLFRRLEQPLRRSIMFYSGAGQGKSSTLAQVATKLVKEDKGTVVINWDTSKIRSSDVLDFFSTDSEYSKECTRLIFVIEDIGGGEVEGNSGPRSVDTALLNLLDGMGVSFRLPTFIVATTNYPDNLIGALIRPGRFDQLIELESPSEIERVRLVEFFKKEDLTDDEVLAAKRAKDFSIAQLQEVVIRSLLKRRTMLDVVDELISYNRKQDKGFASNGANLGL